MRVPAHESMRFGSRPGREEQHCSGWDGQGGGQACRMGRLRQSSLEDLSVRVQFVVSLIKHQLTAQWSYRKLSLVAVSRPYGKP